MDSGDESWNPRARVGPVVPKKDRPTRDGAKRPAVERVLEAAAQRRAFEPVQQFKHKFRYFKLILMRRTFILIAS